MSRKTFVLYAGVRDAKELSMSAEDLSKLRPEDLRARIVLWLADDGAKALPPLNEMERRLKEVDNCICWGVDCVHQAKELAKSYELSQAAERARIVLDTESNLNHAPNLRAALIQLIAALQDAMSRVEDLTEEEKLALKKVLTDYPESKGWKHSSIVFGYLTALGFGPLKANQLQGEYLEGERHHGQSHQQGR